jgi:hypothetical protein
MATGETRPGSTILSGFNNEDHRPSLETAPGSES